MCEYPGLISVLINRFRLGGGVLLFLVYHVSIACTAVLLKGRELVDATDAPCPATDEITRDARLDLLRDEVYQSPAKPFSTRTTEYPPMVYQSNFFEPGVSILPPIRLAAR